MGDWGSRMGEKIFCVCSIALAPFFFVGKDVVRYSKVVTIRI